MQILRYFYAVRSAIAIGLSVVLSAACETDGRQPARGSCPINTNVPVQAGSDSLVTLKPRHFAFQLTIPRNDYTYSSNEDASEQGEAWVDAAGLRVSYTVVAGLTALEPLGPRTSSVSVCRQPLGGREANLEVYYSEASYLPGQVATATWELEGGKTLVITTFHPDSTQRSELLRILRSVRFQ